MSLLRRITGGVRALLWREHTEADLDEELRAYLDTSIAGKMRTGMAQEAAARAARAEMGSLEAVKEYTRDAGWESTIDVFAKVSATPSVAWVVCAMIAARSVRNVLFGVEPRSD